MRRACHGAAARTHAPAADAARRVRAQAGFSLVELMVSMSIGLVSILAVSAVLLSSSNIYRVSDNRARMQESARFGITEMERDVRMAGYMGCFNIDMFPSRYTNLAKDAANYENNYRMWVGGYEAGSGSGWTPGIDAKVGSGGAAPIAGNDVLVVRLPAGPTVPVVGTMPSSAAPIQVAGVKGFRVGGLAIVSDCRYANVFAVTQIPADKKIVHAANRNTAAQLTRVFSGAAGATVTPLTTVAYYVGAASDGVAGNRSLYRQDHLDVPEELADGVEQMQLEYGIDTDATVDGITNKFVTADKVGGASVTAVKVSLLLKSPLDKITLKEQVYNFDGKVDVKAPDRRLYTPYTTTIALRNRVN